MLRSLDCFWPYAHQKFCLLTGARAHSQPENSPMVRYGRQIAVLLGKRLLPASQLLAVTVNWHGFGVVLCDEIKIWLANSYVDIFHHPSLRIQIRWFAHPSTAWQSHFVILAILIRSIKSLSFLSSSHRFVLTILRSTLFF